MFAMMINYIYISIWSTTSIFIGVLVLFAMMINYIYMCLKTPPSCAFVGVLVMFAMMAIMDGQWCSRYPRHKWSDRQICFTPTLQINITNRQICFTPTLQICFTPTMFCTHTANKHYQTFIEQIYIDKKHFIHKYVSHPHTANRHYKTFIETV